MSHICTVNRWVLQNLCTSSVWARKNTLSSATFCRNPRRSSWMCSGHAFQRWHRVCRACKANGSERNSDSSLPKRPCTDPKNVEMSLRLVRRRANKQGQHCRGNQTFGNSSGGLERLVNMASLCLRQEEELQLMRVDRQYDLLQQRPPGLLPYAVVQKWNEAKENRKCILRSDCPR